MTMPSDKTKILVCQLDEKAEIVTSAKATNTHNLLSCLSAATTTVYGLILLCFATRSIHAGFGIIELCRCLKSNPLTLKIPLFASTDNWHRGIAEQMKEAGLDFMDVRPSQNRIDPEYIFDRIRRNAISIHIDQIMSRLCPFLNYTPLNGHRELITCDAWRNQMVLGGKRLQKVCETKSYLHCEYFLNPRPKS